MSEPLSKLDKIEETLKENQIDPRGYVLSIDIKLGQDTNKTATYYIGVPMTKGRATCPFVFSLDRKRALIFKDKETIGRFLSKFHSDLKKTGRANWDGNIYIQDVDNQVFVLDKFHVDLI
jgi:hypothetical protein